jgi:hypothetical protein
MWVRRHLLTEHKGGKMKASYKGEKRKKGILGNVYLREQR